MEIGQIEAFERSARDGSFTRAAEALGLTQPAVSTRINLLEAELGGPLFERGGRELRLTPLGEHFLPYAKRMLNAYEEGKQAAKNFHAGRVGQVKVAAPTPFILSFLVETLAQFRRKNPTIDILIRERNKTVIFDLIHDGAMTLGLVNAPVFDKAMIPLLRFRDPIRAVVSASHTLARYGQRPVPMDAIYRYTIYRVSMFPQMTAFIDDVAEHGRIGSGGAVIAVPMVMALRLVMMGQGVTFLPESYVKHAVDAGELQYIYVEDMPTLNAEPILITHKERDIDQSHQAFIEALRECWQHLLID